MNTTDNLNKMDCTFYFILNEEDKTSVLKEDAQKRICEKFASVMDVRFYGMRSGSGVRSTKALRSGTFSSKG